MKKKLPLFSLVLLVVAAINSIRNLPAIALFGPSMVPYLFLAACLFLFPISLVAAEFSTRYPEEGGIFHWVRRAFGERLGFAAIWLQWINTLVWYPTILSFIAGTAAYLIDPALVEHRPFLLTLILTTFWGLTLLNFRGLSLSAKINSLCSLLGTLLPTALLLLLGATWIAQGHPLSFSLEACLPSFTSLTPWLSLVAIMTSFLGMELSGVYIHELEAPKKNFPKAMAISSLLLLGTILLGSLAIAAVVPGGEIRLVDGVMQTFRLFFEAFGLGWMTPLLALLILMGSSGGMVSWILSPAMGLLQAAEYRFLPPFFAKTNRWGVPTRLLLAQAVIVSLFSIAFLFFPSLNALYWFLTNLSASLYMIMYLLLFLAALKLDFPKGAPTLGLVAASATLLLGYLPPEGMEMGEKLPYPLLVGGGKALLLLPLFAFWRYQERMRERSAPLF